MLPLGKFFVQSPENLSREQKIENRKEHKENRRRKPTKFIIIICRALHLLHGHTVKAGFHIISGDCG